MFDKKFKRHVIKSLIEFLIILISACLARLFKLDETIYFLLLGGYLVIRFLLNGHKVADDDIAWDEMSNKQRIFYFGLLTILVIIINRILLN